MRWLILLSVLLAAAKIAEVSVAAAAMSWWLVFSPVLLGLAVLVILMIVLSITDR